MSRVKSDHILPFKKSEEIENQIKANLRSILRQRYNDRSAAVKWICRDIEVPERTVRSWFAGYHPPSAGNLLILAQAYPAVLCMILVLAGRPDLAASLKQETDENGLGAKRCTINVTMNLKVAKQLNQRQLWFIGMLQQGQSVKVADIRSIWDVSLRAAKYDIAAMTKLGLIRFVRKGRIGWYELR